MSEGNSRDSQSAEQAEFFEHSAANQNRYQEESRIKDLHDIVGLLSQVVEKMASSSGSKPSEEIGSRVDQHLKIFQNFNPPSFKGAGEPTAAEDWLQRIEKILEGMICPENRKVVLASFVLEGEAERWWQVQHRERFGSLPLSEIKWDEFVHVFRTRFLPQSARLVLQDKFFSLTQEGKTVMQYEAEFTSLSRYAPQYVSTSVEKCHRFLRGLQDHLRVALAPLAIHDFSDLVERACMLEIELQSVSRTSQQHYSGQQFLGRKRPIERGEFSRGKQIRYEKQKSVQSQEKPLCAQCGKTHFGKCHSGSGKCFGCGQLGHYKFECPLERRQMKGPGAQSVGQNFQSQRSTHQPPVSQKQFRERSQAGKNQFYGRPSVSQRGETSGGKVEPVKARVFTLQEARETDDVVTGMLFIANQLGSVLFDSGASHSFISVDFLASLSDDFTCVDSTVSVMLPSGDILAANQKCCVSIGIQGRELEAELIIIPIKSFDVILGMDWLIKYFATIEC